MGKQYTTDRDFDWPRTLPREEDLDRYASAVRAVITPENYGVRWCATQFADRDALPLPAQACAEDVLTGYSHVDRREDHDRAIGQHVTVKLEVLTRQACTRDAAGNKIEDASIDEKPQPGDVIDLPVGKRIGARGGPLSAQERAGLRAAGLTENVNKPHQVRDGCIEVPYFLAVGLLADYGFRCTKPQHYTIRPSRRDLAMATATGERPRERMVANWIYREVFDDGSDTVTRESRPRK
jgi:hypothetical protein